MYKAFMMSFGLLGKALLQVVKPYPRQIGAPSLRRLFILALFLPLLTAVQAVHWAGFLLDEVFFRGYRKVKVREPVFITGVPRSGTTLLHRTLTTDSRFTTFSTWELLFGLSVTARKIIMAIGALDRKTGSPLRRAISFAERRNFCDFNSIHKTSLFEPEEDYLTLCPILSCFILVLVFPRLDMLWKMAYFDTDMSAKERNTVLSFYRACLQKHLYVHGEDRRLLSKNASFSGALGSLAAFFPDARFICCTRNPEETIPSVLSSMQGGMRLFGIGRRSSDFRDRIVQAMENYYRNLEKTVSALPADRCAVVDMNQLAENLEENVDEIYSRLGLETSPEFERSLKSAARASRGFRSRHSYSLEQFGLKREKLNSRILPSWRHLQQDEAFVGEPAV
jgi:hypothetical protein